MKKWNILIVLLSLICLLTGCLASPEADYPAAIMVDGAIYLLASEPMPAEVDESAITGYTNSYTDTFPEKDGETNFNRELDMPYAKVEGGVAVLYENEWYFCAPRDSKDIIEGTVGAILNDSSEEKVEATPEWVKEEIHIEKCDVTHDSIQDYVITLLEYDPAFVDADSTQQERIAQQLRAGFIRIEVYEGQEYSEEIDEEKLIWSNDYSGAHAGNGQLSVVSVDGKEWMLTSSLYIGQGYATLDYEIFSLEQNGEKSIFDKQSVEFEMEQGDLPDDYKEFQTSLNKYMEDGILIVACDIDMEQQYVRTKETPYVPRNYYENAFMKFDSQ